MNAAKINTIQTSIAEALGVSDLQAAAVAQWMMRAAKHVEAGVEPEEALKRGQEEYSAFLLEMADGLTSRAKIVRTEIAGEVYAAFSAA